ncbi:glycosyltransferase family 4 protein [Lutispora sp.]|uniref:glycosyltransferase family 4 protein n=1 Tax=Lutispora sp. TaxID=2828727 RepID=UPI002B210C0C|nr:glycosyltransferase family 4 protein [Lutispora sp.]MEA4964004.1 glycosyltransferase family 4 protein [Lutispora sp.]
MGKKICHITSAHGRYDVRIFMKECASLAQKGYDVTLIVNDNKDDEIMQNVKIISTKLQPKNRMQRFSKSRKVLLSKALEVDADIYHLHDPDLLPLGNKLRSKGKKIIFDSHEDVPQQIKDKQWIPKMLRGFIANIYSLYEKISLKKYNAIISVTPHVVERLLKINPNTVMITNYPIINAADEVQRAPELAICFAGGISSQWCHDKVLMAIDKIDNIKYILAGNGTEDYMDLLKSLPAWSKVDYKGKVPHSEVKNIYSKSTAGIAISYSNQAKEEGTLGNTKLFEFMEAKLPVVCTNYRLWKEIVEGNKCGICVEPKNIKEIENAIRYIINNPDEVKIMGENGRRAVIEKYNWEAQEEILLKLYKGL